MPVLTTLKLIGLTGVVSYAVARAAVHFRVLSWHRAHVVAVPRARLPRMPRGYSLREIGFEELDQWVIDISPEQQATRFAQGLACLGAFNSNNDLTGVVWITGSGCTEGDVALFSRPPTNGAWDTGMWIHPDHRLGRTFQALWAGVADWLDARGLDASYSAIADYNVNSLGAHRRLGMVRLGSITALRIGQRQWISAGGARWRFARTGAPIIWQVPPICPVTAAAQLTPSLAR